METKRKKATDFGYVPARTRVTLSPGDAVRIARELQGMTQSELAAAAGLTQATVSSLEKGRVALGVERAERLARALHVHPAVLLWPNWEENQGPDAKRAAG